MATLLRIAAALGAAVAIVWASAGCARLRGNRAVETAENVVAPQEIQPAATEETGPPQAVHSPESEPRVESTPPSPSSEERPVTAVAYRIRPNDPLVIYLRGIMPRDEEIQLIVNERGGIALPFIGEIIAAGKTASELEREIQKTYIERDIYRMVTVNVIVPSQSFFVQGEVRVPQRYPMVTGMTLMQAIAAAGGYTEYADKRRVTLTRGGVVRSYNMREIERDPRLDVVIEPGDVIRVPRSIF
ncbi:MAG: polysaccharide export protein [Kiritimatiellae bacterium]|nr:polysaccharide export protein [Kiritimatiellia bacterium]MDW8458739.1 polysaccharide biosynthesis/export family protein [Verrucomicrobiota bacterium]